MINRPPNRKPSKKTLLLVGLAVILVCGGAASAYAIKKSRNSVTPMATGDENEINYGPPTDEEKKAGDDQKDKNIAEEEKRNQPTTGLKNVAVFVTDADQYEDVVEVRSFIPDHYEDGDCTITFTKGSDVVSKTTSAYRDASTTICTNPLFERSEFSSAGNWSLVVTYKAAGATGKSEAKDVKIQ